LRIVPVLDLRDGQVVRAAGGDRRRYEPLRSPLVDSAEPGAVSAALVKTFGNADLYIADLNAIAGETPDWRALDAIVGGASIAGEGLLGFTLHVDAGPNTQERLAALLSFARQRSLVLRPIVALETLSDPSELAPLAAACAGGGAFSLDLRDGRPMTTCRHWQDASPRSIAEAAIAAGFARLIVIDIARVGGGCGVAALRLCRELHRAHPRLSVWAGGGVRGPADIEAMAASGIDGALVASALHDGCLSAADVARYRVAR
jgi:uncharacterized protein related to proFAR isomerase